MRADVTSRALPSDVDAGPDVADPVPSLSAHGLDGREQPEEDQVQAYRPENGRRRAALTRRDVDRAVLPA